GWAPTQRRRATSAERSRPTSRPGWTPSSPTTPTSATWPAATLPSARRCGPTAGRWRRRCCPP
ncbi:MAG: hypothetical protein AVDCRST_MAG61-901, partial [uncultured Friedmanniella sp.]